MFSLATRQTLGRTTPALFCSARMRSTRFYSSTMHDNDPEVLENEKRRNLRKIQHHTSTPHESSAPGWNEHLASTSEAHVKADKSTESIESLPRKTIDYIHSRHAPEERVERREATYERDEVSGPLGSAVGSEGLSDEEFATGAGVKQNTSRRVKKTKTQIYEEEILENATPSEEAVKADRGEV